MTHVLGYCPAKGPVTNYGEGWRLDNGRGGGGAREVPLQNKRAGGGAEKVLAILKGGGAQQVLW